MNNSYKLLNLYRFKALPSPKGVDLPAKRRGPAKAKRVTKDKEKARSLDGKGLGNLDGKALGNLDGKGLPNHYQQGASQHHWRRHQNRRSLKKHGKYRCFRRVKKHGKWRREKYYSNHRCPKGHSKEFEEDDSASGGHWSGGQVGGGSQVGGGGQVGGGPGSGGQGPSAPHSQGRTSGGTEAAAQREPSVASPEINASMGGFAKLVHDNPHGLNDPEPDPESARPIDLFPLIDWRPVNRRKEILSSGRNVGPYWSMDTMKKIWAGANPQIIVASPIDVLDDSVAKVNLS